MSHLGSVVKNKPMIQILSLCTFDHSLPLQRHTPLPTSGIVSRLQNALQLSAQRRCFVPSGFHQCHHHCLYDLTPWHPSSCLSNSYSFHGPQLQHHPFQESFPTSTQFGLGVCSPNLHTPFIPSYSNCRPAWKLLVFLSVFNASLRAFRWQRCRLSFSMWCPFIPCTELEDTQYFSDTLSSSRINLPKG